MRGNAMEEYPLSDANLIALRTDALIERSEERQSTMIPAA